MLYIYQYLFELKYEHQRQPLGRQHSLYRTLSEVIQERRYLLGKFQSREKNPLNYDTKIETMMHDSIQETQPKI